MKIIHKNQAGIHKNNEACIAAEYPINKEIDGAVIDINGRYPINNRCLNLKSRMLCYVIDGKGKIEIEGEEVNLNEGDLILIEPGEKYFWQGNLKLFISSTPAWNLEQYKEVE